MVEFAAYLSVFIFAALAIFQIALIFGTPLGKYAWGGSHEVLPTKLRIGSGIAIVLYGIFTYLILSKAAVIDTLLGGNTITAGVWIVTAYLGLGTLVNGISKSKYERAVMAPITFILAVAFVIVALS